MAAFDQRRTITSWGRVKRHAAAVARPSYRDEIPDLLHATEAGSVLGVGLSGEMVYRYLFSLVRVCFFCIGLFRMCCCLLIG